MNRIADQLNISEQGPRLEVKRQKIGIVTGVQAYRWHKVVVKGRDCHSGTTDFQNRSDSMLLTAKLILHAHNMAAAESGCLASTGIVTVTPGSINTVPGLVSFTLDLRAAEDARLMRLESQLKADFEKIAQGAPVGDLNKGGISGRACTVEWVLEFSNTAVKFDPDCAFRLRFQNTFGLILQRS